MIKLFWTVALGLSLAITGCTSKKKEEGKEPAVQPAPPPPPPPVGSGSATGSGSAAAGSAAPSPGIDCASEIAITCDAGNEDGCVGQRTIVHACVAKDAKAGPPCAQEIAQKCPDGQADACLRTPPQAKNHVCVIVPKLSP